MSSSEVQLSHPLLEDDCPELPFAEPLPPSSAGASARLPEIWNEGPKALDGSAGFAPPTYARQRPYLVILTTRFQYSLPLRYNKLTPLGDGVAQLKDYLPRSRLELMKHSFWSLVVREPGLRKLANTLCEIGKPMIGDVVQMTADDLVRDALASPREIALLRDHLEKADLGLGMRIANWSVARSERNR